MIINKDLLALRQSDQTDTVFDHLLGCTNMIVTNEWLYIAMDQIQNIRENAPYVYASFFLKEKVELELLMREME